MEVLITAAQQLEDIIKKLPPVHPNPSCYWDSRYAQKRVAILFDRDKIGVEVLTLVGSSTLVDDLARAVAQVQIEALRMS